jgi:hypothetical protein
MAASYGTAYRIGRWFPEEGFQQDPAFQLPDASVRRAVVDSY